MRTKMTRQYTEPWNHGKSRHRVLRPARVGIRLPARSRVSDIGSMCPAHQADTVEIRSAIISDMRVGQPVLLMSTPRWQVYIHFSRVSTQNSSERVLKLFFVQ